MSCTELLSQGKWLERMGMSERVRLLARSMKGEELLQHIAGHARLVDPGQMGALFKVMALHPHGTRLPPGFAA